MVIPAESFFLPAGRIGTLQHQIRQMVTEGILTGRFRAGDKLPSSRGLATHLGISRITVTLAFTDLVASDYLTSRGRSGYFVSDGAPRQPEFAPNASGGVDRVDYAVLSGRRFSQGMKLTKPADWRSYPYPFIYGQVDAALFDHQNWRLCAMRALGKRDFGTLTDDYHERDDPLLIEYILRNILPRRGIHARPENVLITMGAQNGIWLAAQILLAKDRVAVIENPCYPGLRDILQHTDCRIDRVDVDDQGLPPEHLPDTVDVVFTAPSHHSPTNATMPLDRRAALLEAASKRNFVIVEDDYEFEMSFLKSVSPSLKSLDMEGRVIYAGSFSKSIFPGLRLGYLVAPASFIQEARALRVTVLRHPPGHVQRTAAYFLSLGHYDALINRMRQTFRRRRTIMDDAIHDNGLRMAPQAGFGGSSIWMRAPDHVNTAELAPRLQAKGVLIEPGRVFFDPAVGPQNYYRLAYSSIASTRIAEGIGLIAGAMMETGPS